MATLRRLDLDLATGSNDGTSWANAFQTWAAARAVCVTGDVLMLKYNSDETTAGTGSILIDPNFATGDALHVICVDSADDSYTRQTTTPNFATTSGTADDVTIDDCLALYGVYLDSVDRLYIGNGDSNEAGLNYQVKATASADFVELSWPYPNAYLECDVDAASLEGGVSDSANEFIGGSIQTDSTNSMGLFYEPLTVGVDFSSTYSQTGATFKFVGCNMLNITDPFASGSYKKFASLYGSTDATTNNALYFHMDRGIAGDIYADTDNYRSGGATLEGTTNYSLHIVGAQAWHALPLLTDWQSLYLEGDGSTTVTATVYIANEDSVTFDDVDVFLQFCYYGSASNTKHTIAYVDNIFPTLYQAGTDHATDSASSWTGLTAPTKQKIVLTLDGTDWPKPARDGMAMWRVGVRTDTEAWIDPKIVIS